MLSTLVQYPSANTMPSCPRYTASLQHAIILCFADMAYLHKKRRKQVYNCRVLWTY